MTSLLPETWSVPQNFRDRLGDHIGRQRAMESDGHLLLVLHQPPHPDDNERRGRLFWRDESGEWRATGSEGVLRHLKQYAEALRQCEQQEEEAATADEYFRALEVLSPLYRATRHLHQTLQDARKLFPADRHLINWRDQAYALERLAELLYQNAKNALDFAAAKQAELQSQASHRMAISAHRLNMLAAFFFPLATLSTILGVNMKIGIEELPPPWPFAIFLTVGLLCGTIMACFVRVRGN